MRTIKYASITAAMLLLGAAAIFAATPVASNTPPPPVLIGTAQPETDPSAVGWDTTPAQGNWGGRGADGSFAVVWENDSPDWPQLFGRWAEVTIPGKVKVLPTKVTIGFLAGQANDSYCVYVKDFRSTCPSSPNNYLYIEIGCYLDDPMNMSETWISRDFELPSNIYHASQPLTIKIEVQANAWPSFATFGQLAVDYITVWGVNVPGN